MKPLVSFIIPIYQQEDYVADAINSALSQTVEDLEVIVIDDGSRDGSAAIVERIQDDRLRFYKQANGGPSAALNSGLKLARGDYVALLGGDDIAEPDRLSSQLKYLKDSNIDMVFSLPKIIDSLGDEINDARLQSVFQQMTCPDPAVVFRRLIIAGNFLCAPSVLMRRDVVNRVGTFRNELVQLQDYDYWLRATALGCTLSVMPKKTTRYRRHVNNLSAQKGDLAVKGELADCICRALLESPPEIIASAFTDMMPPDSKTVTLRDRAIIALTHPLTNELSANLLLRHFLSADCAEENERPPLGFETIGLLISTRTEHKFWLKPELET